MNKKAKTVVKTVAGTIGVIGAVTGGMAGYMYQKNKKKLSEHEGQNNLMYTVNLGGLTIKTKEDTDNVFLSSTFSGIKIDMTEHPIAHDVMIDLMAIYSGVNIYVPEGVKVICDVSVKSGNILNEAEECDDPFAPVVHIVGNSMYSGIAIRKGTAKSEEN